MLDNERAVLKGNAERLANLLTENVPYLLSHFMKNGILSEEEREDIISAIDPQEIRLKLLVTLADKEGVSVDDVIEGLDTTGNQDVSREINDLLGRPDHVEDVGAGDIAEVSAYATDLVDGVIAEAEQATAQQSVEARQDEEIDSTVDVNGGEYSYADEEQVEEVINEPLVEADVQVHHSEPEAEEVEEEEDVVDKDVSSPTTVSSVIEDQKSEDEEEEVQSYKHKNSNGHEIEAEENLNEEVDIEKEFVMPETNNNEKEESKRQLTRMASNEVVIEGENEVTSGGQGDAEELTSVQRKALVKQQVQMFEKTAPGGGKGKVQYSFRASGQEKQEVPQDERSNVKNLKNFFQNLSTSDAQNPLPSGPVKPVGKLRSPYPAS